MKFDLKDWALSVLKTPTDRDKQKLIGPSGLGNMCTRCLADHLYLGQFDETNRFWLGGVIGTAIHALFESRVKDDPEVLTEYKTTIGEIPGYGTIKGTTDIYHKTQKAIYDLKSTTRKKLAMYRRVLVDSDPSPSLVSYRHTIQGYVNQVMTYGKGMSAAGFPVKQVGIVFVPRDGTGDTDLWAWTTPYDANRAEQVWNRANNLWVRLQDGNDPATLPSAEGCYYCTTQRGID